ncbi:hypothetical protein SAMN05444172_9463 [Burkholderia sp. GAS332]|nr:hypothetical protein SAMN05444172_9463 [Burkholderia sp. GAS332]
MAFTAGHVQAIIGLGGQNPSQHWAEFDVSVGGHDRQCDRVMPELPSRRPSRRVYW